MSDFYLSLEHFSCIQHGIRVLQAVREDMLGGTLKHFKGYVKILKNMLIIHKKRLQNHINSEVSRLLNVQNIPRRFKGKKLFELVKE
jgi:hypothetical protein